MRRKGLSVTSQICCGSLKGSRGFSAKTSASLEYELLSLRFELQEPQIHLISANKDADIRTFVP